MYDGANIRGESHHQVSISEGPTEILITSRPWEVTSWLPRAGWLKAAEVYTLTALEAGGLQSGCRQSQDPLKALGRTCSPPFSLLPGCVCARSVVSDFLQHHGLWSTRLLCPWNFPGKNAGVDRHFLLQGIFPTQGSNPRLLYLLH